MDPHPLEFLPLFWPSSPSVRGLFLLCQLQIATDTEHPGNWRAYVSVKGREGDFSIVAGQIVAQPLQIKNFGLTPSLKGHEDSRIIGLPYPLTFQIQMGKQEPGAAISSLTIFPSEDFPTIAKSVVAPTQEDITKYISDAKYRLYVIANITYQDAFGITHWTHMCGYYGNGDRTMTYCDRYERYRQQIDLSGAKRPRVPSHGRHVGSGWLKRLGRLRHNTGAARMITVDNPTRLVYIGTFFRHSCCVR